MSGRKLTWGLRYPDGTVEEEDSRSDCLRTIAHLEPSDGEAQIVVQMNSPWMPEHVVAGVVDVAMPAIECRNCKGTNLGFEVTATTRLPSAPRVEFYQACNDCSETLWTGDWELFHAVLGVIYEIRIPRLD